MKNRDLLIYGTLSAIGFTIFGMLSTYIRNTSRDFDIGVALGFALGFLIGIFEMLLMFIIVKYFKERD